MKNNYCIALNHEWEKVEKMSPKDICNRLNVDYYQDKFKITYYGKNYIIDVGKRYIYNEISSESLEIIDSIIILNYLTYSSSNVEDSETWLSLKELRGGGVLFYPAFHKSTIQNIIKYFGNDITQLEIASIKLKGKPIEFGDRGFVFNILPKINIAIVVWEGDEDFSPNASVLFQSSIQHLLHIETIIGLAMNLVDKLINIK